MQFPLSWYYSHGVFPFIHLDLKKKEAWQKLLSKQIESKRKKYEAITYIPNGNGSTLDYSQIIPRKIMREMELKCDKFGGREIDSLDSSKGNLINLSLCNSFFKWKLKKKILAKQSLWYKEVPSAASYISINIRGNSDVHIFWPYVCKQKLWERPVSKGIEFPNESCCWPKYTF